MRIRSSGGSDGFSSGGRAPGSVLADSQAPLSILQRSIRQGLYVQQPRVDDGDLPTQAAQPFDFYLSPTGSDTNTGTAAAPWAITSLQANNANNPKMAGKRVGLLPGTYNVSALMGTNEAVAALTLPSGSSGAAPTYIGSSDSSGNYSRGTATIDCAQRAAFTADVAVSSTATFTAAMAANSNQVVLSSVVGTPQAGMLLSGGTLTVGGGPSGYGPNPPTPVYLVSLVSGSTWTTNFTAPSGQPWTATGMTGTVAALTLDTLTSGSLGAGMISVSASLPAGAMITGGSGTNWTLGASIASPLTAISVTGTIYGGNNDNQSSIMSIKDGKSFCVVDGLVFAGFSMWAFHIGTAPGGGANVANWAIQNCEFTGQNCSYATHANFVNGVNCGQIIVYESTLGLVTNSFFHANVGNPRDTQHWSWIYQWGLGTSPTQNNTYTFNSVLTSGNFQGKEANQFNTEIAYNYIDMTAQLATSEFTGGAIFGCMSDSAGVGTATKWHHNILLANNIALDFNNTNPTSSFVKSPLFIYNNTVVVVGNRADGYVNGGYTGTGVANQVSSYNNLYYDAGQVKSQYGYWLTNTNTFALCDFNIYGHFTGAGIFNTVPIGANSSAGLTGYSSLAAWGAAIAVGGVSLEAHSSMNTVNPFVGGAPGPSFYELNGAVGVNTGRIGGVPGGAPCNNGAWDGTSTQIGSNFAVYS